jgi:hypothetical protein
MNSGVILMISLSDFLAVLDIKRPPEIAFPVAVPMASNMENSGSQ